jgi:hypothetical protein
VAGVIMVARAPVLSSLRTLPSVPRLPGHSGPPHVPVDGAALQRLVAPHYLQADEHVG